MAILERVEPKCKPTQEDLHPPPTNGIHGWICGRAVYLKKSGVGKEEAIGMIKGKAGGSSLRRPLKPNEVENTAAHVFGGKLSKSSGGKLSRLTYKPKHLSGQWPAIMQQCPLEADPQAIEKACEAVEPWSLVDAWEDSPLRVDECSPEQVLSMLFEPSDLLCIGAVSSFQVLTMSEWLERGASGEQVVPNPNAKKYGATKDGRPSGHCRDAVGQRRHLVVEFDDESLGFDRQATLLRFLRDKAGGRLRMIVHSGGKSLHGWFDAHEDEEVNWDFMKLAARLGADRRMWLPEQFARTPNAIRSNGNWQKVMYLEPRP